MERFQGLIGIVVILGIAFLFSNNKKKINLRLVGSGLLLQTIIAICIFKIPIVRNFFQSLGKIMTHIEAFAHEGAGFVYGGLMATNYAGGSIPYSTPGVFIFGFSVLATIILVCVLVAILYQYGIMQKIVSWIAKAMNYIMRVSGAEALSNVASAFVGQVEAQVMIRPYLQTMTNSELLASMSGSLACIAGGILVVYVSFGAKAEYLLAASIMAAPGALVISKIVFPETEESQTMGNVKLEIKKPYENIIDAISHGASDGMKISINVIAMLIGFIALIAMVNYILGSIHDLSQNMINFIINIPAGIKSLFTNGYWDIPHTFHWGAWMNWSIDLSLNKIFGWIFYPITWCMGVPSADVGTVATLLGQKLTINEFIAFSNMTSKTSGLTPSTEKGLLIASIAICGFANFSSVGMQIGGIGELAPGRRADLAKLGMKALLCGTLASYLSATIAGILM